MESRTFAKMESRTFAKSRTFATMENFLSQTTDYVFSFDLVKSFRSEAPKSNPNPPKVLSESTHKGPNPNPEPSKSRAPNQELQIKSSHKSPN
jgi:hypothetical protein